MQPPAEEIPSLHSENPACHTAAKGAAHSLGRENKLDIISTPVFTNVQLLYWNKKQNTSQFMRRESFCTPKNPRLHVSGSMTSVTTVCCGKAQPQPKAQGPSPTYLQRPCKENPSTRPPSDSVVKLPCQFPLPILPHLCAHRKAQSSYF